jgi:hypothetical protein
MNKSTTRKLITCIITVFVIFSGYAQDIDCDDRLDKARKLFDAGKLEKVESTLQPCMEKGFNNNQKTEAYQIIILTQQYDNRPADAEATFLELLGHDPEFEVNEANTPQELLHLMEKHHAPPLWSAGVVFGGVISNARRSVSYSTGDSKNETKTYSPDGTGYVIGLRVNRFITTDIEIGGEIQLMRQKFKSTSDQFGFATIESSETQDWVQLPIMGTYDFSHGKWEPFVRLGVVPAFLVSANATLKRLDNTENLGAVTGPDIDMLPQRNTFNVASLFGAGVKYKIPRAFLILEVRHSWYFLNQVETSQRYGNPELLNQYLYVDDDFNLGNIQILLGFTYSFHKIKTRKKSKSKDKDRNGTESPQEN